MAFKFQLLILTVTLLCTQVLTRNIDQQATEIVSITTENAAAEKNAHDVDANVDNNDLDSVENDATELNTTRDSLYYNLSDEYFNLALESLSNLKTMFNNSIADMSLLKGTNEKINEYIKQLKDFITQIEYVETSSDADIYNRTHTLFNKTMEYLDKFNATAVAQPTIEDLLLELTLIKNDFNNYKYEILDSFYIILENLQVDAEEYWDSLTAEEKATDEAFGKWLTKFKNLDSDNAEELYEQFLDLYEDEE